MKDSLSDLAIFGGAPAFAEKLHVGRPNIGDRARLLQRINTILDNRWLTNTGPFEQELEQRIADLTGAAHCIAMCNATLALEIAIRALELSGEVIVPSFTFIATAHALQWQEITPVFCDIDPRTYNLDPRRVEQMITPATTGIIPVHAFGRPCDVGSLAEIAARRGLKLLFDSAHAFGCSYHGRMIGSFGDAEIFSFHATKFINSFEGGAVVTNNDVLAGKMRLMRNFGFAGYDYVSHVGINAKITEVCAAMGLTSLEAMDEIVAVNRRNWEVYREELMALPGISLIEYDPKENNNYHYVVIEVDPERAPLNRDELLAVLHAENVLARRYFWPGCHRMEPYRSSYPDAHLFLPQTERAAARVITLPTGQVITPETIRIVCDIINTAFENAGEIRKLLEKEPAD
ncbi:MAG TPA: DegT/DnrJ/EryC1/StrS family aminotransferase [Pyrinomonadaceae bacterium]|nr:DegT/DnrJ/EryC1/StrS family aminotransferase [Pyrinomonadaceae bacterium]